MLYVLTNVSYIICQNSSHTLFSNAGNGVFCGIAYHRCDFTSLGSTNLVDCTCSEFVDDHQHVVVELYRALCCGCISDVDRYRFVQYLLLILKFLLLQREKMEENR